MVRHAIMSSCINQKKVSYESLNVNTPQIDNPLVLVNSVVKHLTKKILIDEKLFINVEASKKPRLATSNELNEITIANFNVHGTKSCENYLNELIVRTNFTFIFEHLCTNNST